MLTLNWTSLIIINIQTQFITIDNRFIFNTALRIIQNNVKKATPELFLRAITYIFLKASLLKGWGPFQIQTRLLRVSMEPKHNLFSSAVLRRRNQRGWKGNAGMWYKPWDIFFLAHLR